MTDPYYYMLLAAVGLVAGVVNTLAGGGSNLTLPVLMLMGLPADVANGTNRLAIGMQCVAGTLSFRRHGKLETKMGDYVVAFTLGE